MAIITYDLNECYEYLAKRYFMYSEEYIRAEIDCEVENINEWIDDAVFAEDSILDNGFFCHEFHKRQELNWREVWPEGFSRNNTFA